MSSNMYSGYSVEKSTSRVLNPPGGRSNNIFGTSEEPLANKTNQTEGARKQNISNIFGENTNNDTNKNVNNKITKSNVFHPDEKSQYQVGGVKSKRTGFNPITGKSYAEEEEVNGRKDAVENVSHEKPHETLHQPQQQAQNQPQPQPQEQPQQPPVQHNVHTSTRIHHPPGGRSTKLW